MAEPSDRPSPVPPGPRAPEAVSGAPVKAPAPPPVLEREPEAPGYRPLSILAVVSLGVASLYTAIVLMTGAIDREDEFGAAPWPRLRKPFRLGALLHAIDLALGSRTIIRHAGDQAQV